MNTKKIKNILISQPKPLTTDSIYFEIAKKHNITIDFKPFTKTQVIETQEFIKFKIKILQATTIVFTTKASIEHFFKMTKKTTITLTPELKYIFPSQQLAIYVNKYATIKKRKILINTKNKKNIDKTLQAPKENFIIISSNNKTNTTISDIKNKKLNYTEIPLCNTIPANLKQLNIQKYDIITLFTPLEADALIQNFPQLTTQNTKIATFGNTTAQHLKNKYKITPSIKAPLPQAPSMANVLAIHIKNNN